MTVSAKKYLYADYHAYNGDVDWLTDTIKVAICSSSYTPDQDAHDYFDDITNEVSGTGYTAGGDALASKTIGVTGATNKLKLDAADVDYSSYTITGRYAIVYKSTGTASTSPLLGYVDFGEDVTSPAITWDADGVFETTTA